VDVGFLQYRVDPPSKYILNSRIEYLGLIERKQCESAQRADSLLIEVD